jgi:hypothetical protein
MRPVTLRETFPPELQQRLLTDCDLLMKRGEYSIDPGFNRIISNSGRLYIYAEHLLPIVRQVFGDDSIVPSYNCWARYSSAESRLPAHKDSNACTFTVDYCVQQHEPWPLYVEGTEYLLQENQSLLFMGEDQEHWRPEFKPGNMVEMIFFHFVRPDHWYFTE